MVDDQRKRQTFGWKRYVCWIGRVKNVYVDEVSATVDRIPRIETSRQGIGDSSRGVGYCVSEQNCGVQLLRDVLLGFYLDEANKIAEEKKFRMEKLVGGCANRFSNLVLRFLMTFRMILTKPWGTQETNGDVVVVNLARGWNIVAWGSWHDSHPF